MLIRRSLPDLLGGSGAILECTIAQLSPGSLCVTLQANGEDVSEQQYVDLPDSTEPQSITRRFTVPAEHRNRDKTFTCRVNQGFQHSWVSKSTGKIFGGR